MLIGPAYTLIRAMVGSIIITRRSGGIGMKDARKAPNCSGLGRGEGTGYGGMYRGSSSDNNKAWLSDAGPKEYSKVLTGEIALMAETCLIFCIAFE